MANKKKLVELKARRKSLRRDVNRLWQSYNDAKDDLSDVNFEIQELEDEDEE